MSVTATSDLCDAHRDDTGLRVLAADWRAFGGRSAFAGPVTTLQCFEDNTLVRAALEQAGEGRVLVVDGGGSLRCALMGDMIGESAVQNGWEGVIVYGCVRDVDALGTLDLGVHAVAAIPLKSVRKGVGETNVPVTFGGVTFLPGQYVYADNNGVIVADKKLV